jgi:P4 family phage/plasmid primase-like protien
MADDPDTKPKREPRAEDIYFDGPRGRLIEPVLEAAVRNQLQAIRVGPDGMLYVYDNGMYRPGAADVRHVAKRLLNSRWSIGAANTVVVGLEDAEGADPLSYNPPEGRFIYAANGRVNLDKSTLYPYSHNTAWVVKLPWDYDPAAAAPVGILRFLGDVLVDMEASEEEHQDMVRHWLEIVGYTLMTSNPLRKAVLLHGQGRNGKSIMLYLLTALLGKGNYSAVRLQRLAGDSRFDGIQLLGKLANVCGDISSAATKDTGFFKQLTGGDDLYGEHKGRDPVKFRSCATPIFSCNDYPGSVDTSSAYINRWLVLDLPRQFAEDAAQEAKLRALVSDPAEMRGFMRLAVEAAMNLMNRGDFQLPAAALEAHDEFAGRVDSVRQFASTFVMDPGHVVVADVAYDWYVQWVAQQPGKKNAVGQRKFYDRMGGLNGVTKFNGTNNVLSFRGIAIPVERPNLQLRS